MKREYVKLPLVQGTYESNIVFDASGIEFCASHGMLFATRARAEFIVQACNSFDTLLAVLETALTLFEDECTPDELDAYAWKFAAQEAIAKAEGKEGEGAQ